MEIARLKAVVEIDDTGFRRGLQQDAEALQSVDREAKQAGSSVETFGQKLGKIDGSRLQDIGRNLSLGVTAPLIASAGAATMMASGTEEALNRVQVVFGSGAKAIEDWSKTAAVSFGQSRQEALSAAGDFGSLFVAMEIGQGQAAQMSRTMVQLAGDLASFKDASPQEAMVALRAGLVGESEPLRRFGVNLSEAKIQAEALAMGLVKVKGEALDPATKAQAAYNIILRETKTAQGDYNRTSDSFANTLRTAKSELSDVAAEFGKELIPVMKDALTTGRDLLHWFKELPDPMKKATVGGLAFAAALGPILSGAGTLMKIGGMFGLGAGGAGAATAGTAAVGTTAAAGTGLGLSTGALAVGGAAAVGAGAGLFSALPKELQGLVKWLAPGLPAGSIELAEFLPKALAAGGAPKGKPGAGSGSGSAPVTGAQADYSPITGTRGAIVDPKADKLRAQAGDAEFAFRMQQATNAAAIGPEQLQAQREAASGVPLLTARAKELAAEAAALQPKIRESAEEARKYWTLKREEQNLIEQASKLQREAQKEVAENQKRAAEAQKTQWENVRRFQDNAYREQLAGAEAQAASRTEDGKALGRLEEVLPVLEQRQKQLTQEAKGLEPFVRSSWDAALRRQEVLAEIASIERQEQQIQRSAIEERQRNEKQAADEAKKNAEKIKQGLTERANQLKQISEQVVSAFKSQNAERLGIQSATTALQEAKLKNNPFLNDRQKAAEMNRFLTAEIFEKSRSVQGETMLEKLQRRTEVQGLFGKVVENLGGFQRLGRRGSAQLMQQFEALTAQAEATPVTSRAVTESQRAAREAAALAPKPMVMQLFLGEKATPGSLWKAFQTFQAEQNRRSGLIGAAG